MHCRLLLGYHPLPPARQWLLALCCRTPRRSPPPPSLQSPRHPPLRPWPWLPSTGSRCSTLHCKLRRQETPARWLLPKKIPQRTTQTAPRCRHRPHHRSRPCLVLPRVLACRRRAPPPSRSRCSPAVLREHPRCRLLPAHLLRPAHHPRLSPSLVRAHWAPTSAMLRTKRLLKWQAWLVAAGARASLDSLAMSLPCRALPLSALPPQQWCRRLQPHSLASLGRRSSGSLARAWAWVMASWARASRRRRRVCQAHCQPPSRVLLRQPWATLLRIPRRCQCRSPLRPRMCPLGRRASPRGVHPHHRPPRWRSPL